MMSEEKYPRVIERARAVFIDSIVVIALLFVITYVISLFENVPDVARIAAFVFVFVLYDPLFTSIFGGTLGHMLSGLRVRRESDEQKNILFPLAILRYLLKSTLGVISWLTVSGNSKRKAIHDFAAGSVVIYVKSKK